MSDAGDDDQFEAGPGDFARWQTRQRALAAAARTGSERVAANDIDAGPALAGGLAELLWDFHDDKRLWKQLRKHKAQLDRTTPRARVQLRAAAEIDWAPLLLEAGYEPPPSAEVFADEFRMDIRRALDGAEGVDIGVLRDRVGDLARFLDGAAADERPGAAERAFARVRQALPAIGRAGLVNGVAALATSGTLAVAAPLGPVAPLAGPLAGAAVRTGLDRMLPKVSDPQDVPNEAIPAIVAGLLRPDATGRAIEQLRRLDRLANERTTSIVVAADQAGLEEAVGEIIDWIDRSLAVVFLVWEDLAAQGRDDPALGYAASLLTDLRANVAGLGPGWLPLHEMLDRVSNELTDILYRYGAH